MSGLAAEKARLDAGAEPVDWLEEACSLEDQIWAHARRAPSGEIVWLHPSSSRDPADPRARLGPDLYDGVTGVALFLAAVEHITGSSERRGQILQALEPVRHQLRRWIDDPEAMSHPSLGGMSGLGGYTYGLLLIGRWLDEAELIDEAAAMAALITPERIEADESLDVLHGCAGALLGLLALDRVLGEPSQNGVIPVERALACGEHLLHRRASHNGQPRAWPARDGIPRCGFGHGTAGIAYALGRLFERTRQPDFQEAAEEAMNFECLHYSPERGNWVLPGIPGAGVFNSWCHGAPGIVLGHLGMLGINPARRLETGHALRITLTCPVSPCDFLCCGEMGKAEVLLQAYQILREESLLAGAERIASQVVLQSRSRGGRYRWFGSENSPFSPTFFRGAAGVGYSLLRLARPSSLPCVLSLE